jgi:hypothetical protein
MSKNLFQIATEYVRILEKIETTNDTRKLQNLMELLKQQGIKYKDRDHATRIAIRIAKQEL